MPGERDDTSPLDRFMAGRGGLEALCDATAVSMSSVEKWRRSGVPEERWDAVIRHLRANGHRVDANDLHRLNGRIWLRSAARGFGNVATRRQPARTREMPAAADHIGR